MRISVSITKEDLQLIDDHCKSTGIKRSTFLTRSALKELVAHDGILTIKQLNKAGELFELESEVREK